MAGNDDQQNENSAEELETADEAKEEPVPGEGHEEDQEQPESGGFFDQKPTDNSELSLENINLKINDNSGFLKLSRFQSKFFDGDDLIISSSFENDKTNFLIDFWT